MSAEDRLAQVRAYTQHIECARTVCAVLDVLCASDPTGRRATHEPGIGDPGAQWRFSFAGSGMFVTAFAPCYPPSSSRYQFGIEGFCFILFQPDAKLDDGLVLKASPGVRERFKKHGRAYESVNNREPADNAVHLFVPTHIAFFRYCQAAG